jgi:plastocyanin
MPNLVGRYIFGDFSGSLFMPDGAIFVAEEDANGQWQFSEAAIATEQNGRLNRFVLSFGQDEDGEVYVLTATSAGPTGSTGEVFKLVPASSDGEGAIEIDVENFRFDADDTNGTQVDMVMINVGDTVRWTWRAGVHTITSGEGSSAPDAGALFDEPSDASNQTFSFTFNEAGTFPYFCRFHEAVNMRGVIVVQ